MISVAYFVVFLLSMINAAEGAIGVNWGRHTSQRLIPAMVVDLLLQNGVKEARVYTSETDILQAFAKSSIKLTVTMWAIGQINTYEQAQLWVKHRAQLFDEANVGRVLVGNAVFEFGMTNKTFLNGAIDLMETVQKALNEEGLGDRIKATQQHNTEIILKDNIARPSEAEFRDEIKKEMIRHVGLLKDHNAPFVIEMFLISRVTNRSWDMDFAFLDNRSKRVIKDVNGAIYTNYFEFEYDCVVWALEKIGAPDLKIVGQVGWPTDGFPGANTSSAERFYKSFLPYIASNKGTPKRPGVPIDVYVHALTDENKTPVKYPYTRHWGIYMSNGEPKYKIDLSGQGRDIYPPKVQGISRMPKRWCVFNGKPSAMKEAMRAFERACKEADCTTLMQGGSCSRLNITQKISYAFNMKFQSQFQNEEKCDMNGLGKVVTENPSMGTCVFPVEVVKGEQIGFWESSGVNRLSEKIPGWPIFVFLLFNLLSLLVLDY